MKKGVNIGLLLLSMALLWVSLPIHAQQIIDTKVPYDLSAAAPVQSNTADYGARAERDSVEWRVYFRQAHRWLDPQFRDNHLMLDRMVQTLNDALHDSTLVHIDIQAWASPEGRIKLNTNLSIWRAEALANYILQHTSIPDSMISKFPGKVGWSLLRKMVDESDRPYREEVLDILDNTPFWVFDNQGRIVDSRDRQLKSLHGGQAWMDMYERFFPDIRSSVAVFIHLKDSPHKPHIMHADADKMRIAVAPVAIPAISLASATTSAPPVVLPIAIPPTPSPSDEPTIRSIPDTTCIPDTIYLHDTVYIHDTLYIEDTTAHRPFYMDLRTNLVYDAMLVPNVGAEFHIAKNWTVMANVMYAWWHTDITHYYWRIYGGDLAIRKYFGKLAKKKPLQGHHLGAYAQLFTFDVEWGKRGYMGGKPGGDIWDRHNYIFALEYGFSLPVLHRMNIDFSIGAGYHGGTYHEYLPIDDHYVWQATKQRHFWGPTKAEISLVWLIGRDNVNENKEKGGKHE